MKSLSLTVDIVIVLIHYMNYVSAVVIIIPSGDTKLESMKKEIAEQKKSLAAKEKQYNETLDSLQVTLLHFRHITACLENLENVSS